MQLLIRVLLFAVFLQFALSGKAPVEQSTQDDEATVGEICKDIDLLPVSQKRTGLEGWRDFEVRAWFAGRTLPATEVIAERWGHLAFG